MDNRSNSSLRQITLREKPTCETVKQAVKLSKPPERLRCGRTRCILFSLHSSGVADGRLRLADDFAQDTLRCSIPERAFGLFDQRHIQITRSIAAQIETFRSKSDKRDG